MPLNAQEGSVKLKNGHVLPGDIAILGNGDVRVDRFGSIIIFTKQEVRSVQYDTNAPKKSKKNRSFYAALNNTQSMVSKRSKTMYDYLIKKTAAMKNIESALVKAVIDVESGFDQYGTSGKGAQGLMQLMPDTAKSLGVKDPYDPRQNIAGGCLYLSQMLDEFGGDVYLALAAYNAGPHAVKKYGRKIPPYKETQEYVKKVLRAYRQYKTTRAFYGFTDNIGCVYISNYQRDKRYTEIK
jgi:soluble lytic murein transglycosylase-like protein